eukprot:TRINITY_DN43425_c0_g1_i1.p1 TRINITY_DN43425_c0_g1~~TRINITY_DN43425_c0_g1_i1.p1  ORF type:complete len:737 (-),score=80.26 TRINITY_DN43425_c0_g1_i1:9-2219(-)
MSPLPEWLADRVGQLERKVQGLQIEINKKCPQHGVGELEARLYAVEQHMDAGNARLYESIQACDTVAQTLRAQVEARLQSLWSEILGAAAVGAASATLGDVSRGNPHLVKSPVGNGAASHVTIPEAMSSLASRSPSRAGSPAHISPLSPIGSRCASRNSLLGLLSLDVTHVRSLSASELASARRSGFARVTVEARGEDSIGSVKKAVHEKLSVLHRLKTTHGSLDGDGGAHPLPPLDACCLCGVSSSIAEAKFKAEAAVAARIDVDMLSDSENESELNEVTGLFDNSLTVSACGLRDGCKLMLAPLWALPSSKGNSSHVPPIIAGASSMTASSLSSHAPAYGVMSPSVAAAAAAAAMAAASAAAGVPLSPASMLVCATAAASRSSPIQLQPTSLVSTPLSSPGTFDTMSFMVALHSARARVRVEVHVEARLVEPLRSVKTRAYEKLHTLLRSCNSDEDLPPLAECRLSVARQGDGLDGGQYVLDESHLVADSGLSNGARIFLRTVGGRRPSYRGSPASTLGSATSNGTDSAAKARDVPPPSAEASNSYGDADLRSRRETCGTSLAGVREVSPSTPSKAPQRNVVRACGARTPARTLAPTPTARAKATVSCEGISVSVRSDVPATLVGKDGSVSASSRVQRSSSAPAIKGTKPGGRTCPSTGTVACTTGSNAVNDSATVAVAGTGGSMNSRGGSGRVSGVGGVCVEASTTLSGGRGRTVTPITGASQIAPHRRAAVA